MRSVTLAEFQKRAAELLLGDEALSVERDGQSLGYYIPAPRSSDAAKRRAHKKLEQSLARLRSESGLSEDELADLLSRPN